MKKVAFVLYRKWAYDIFKNIATSNYDHSSIDIPILITTPTAEFDIKDVPPSVKVYTVEGKDNEKILSLLKECDIDAVFYYGWSWFVREPILSDYMCLCLHPSPLPLYRGGSPIQNQILAGETMSAVSVFRITEGVDDGDIYKQVPISLEGTLDDIFSRMVSVGTEITKSFISDLSQGTPSFTPQRDLEQNPPYKRRTKEEGEIDIAKAEAMPYKAVYNLVRALADPYPNAYITLPDRAVLLQNVEQVQQVDAGSWVINDTKALPTDPATPVFLRVGDGYAHITKYKTVIAQP